MGKAKNVGGRKCAGRDYSRELAEMLPEIIGKKAKTVQEIADEGQRSEQTTRALIDRLKADEKIHIKSWQRGLYGGRITAKYLWGKGEDAKKLKPLTDAECTKRYQKTDKGIAAKKRYLAKQKGSGFVISSVLKMNPLMSAIYGASA
ncbi:MAG: hypothetical protein JNJ95_04895 [Dechloromonas sp.]|nr:hypothetical protein [Dechloromonas sp.]